ncbi:MAG: hypothetical protein D6732_14960 [Methanobacteriota archaeon]|nr:MAG: hypothetical protein D6732_14960 [Euryarchaeota archaeon]
MEDIWPIVVMHNISSSSRCTEFVRIASGLGYKTMVISQAQGSAAQKGVPAAQKLAFKERANFLVLYSLQDVVDLFSPEEVILVAPPPYGKEKLDKNLAEQIKGRKYAIVFGGSDPGLSRKDLDMGRSVQLPVGDIGSIGTLSIGLAILKGLITTD